MHTPNTKHKPTLYKLMALLVAIGLALVVPIHSADAASCIDLADVPLDAMEQSGPGIIMFVLDDSGSMDWSTSHWI